jgi:hypothetical protein
MAYPWDVLALVAVSVLGGWVLFRLWVRRTAHWPRRPSPLLGVAFGILVFCLCLAAIGLVGQLTR